MLHNLNKSIFALVCLLIAGCSGQALNAGTPTNAPFIITATLPHIPTSQPFETALQPSPHPTAAPIAGVTSTQLNVRTEPSTAGEVLGVIAANEAVQIIGKDIGGNWWLIIYEAGVDGTAWVTSEYVETGDSSQIPVIGGGESDPLIENTAIIIQQINVRSGPGTGFDSIGILNANDVVTLAGKNGDGSWLQIMFPSDPSGKGWVNSGFVKTDDVTGLPIVSESGSVIGTGTPVDTPLPSTPTLFPAPMDFDSADAPIKTILLGKTSNIVLYSGDVSSPNGDIEDWISVTTQQDVIFAQIECFGGDQIDIDIIGAGIKLGCNENIAAVAVTPNVPFLIHIKLNKTDQLQYTKYLLELKLSP